MKISKQNRRSARTLFQACKVGGVLDDGRVRTAVTAVAARKPRGYLGTLQHFQRLVKLDLARRTARVESAVALPAAVQQQIAENLARTRGTGLNVTFVENRALIGGLRVTVGSDVYDANVAARLASLADGL